MPRPRQDNAAGVKSYQGCYSGGKALIVLGGVSALFWEELRDELKPDVLLGANGTCFKIQNLDFHLVVENMHLAESRARQGDERFAEILKIITAPHNAKVRMVSYLSWDLLPDNTDAISIKRMGELRDDYEAQFKRFSFRRYGDGFLAGPLFERPGAMRSSRIKFRVGTVGTQLIHLAGILGVSEVHTIGMDFCFKHPDRHHWYEYPKYEPDKFRTENMFTEYVGLKTQYDWIQGAHWLKSIEPLFKRDSLRWVDHSHGLFKAMGLECTK